MFSTFSSTNETNIDEKYDKESQTFEEVKESEISNTYEYVITINNLPYRIYNEREKSIEFMWDFARSFADSNTDTDFIVILI